MVSFNRRIVRILEEGGHAEMDVLAKASKVATLQDQSVTHYLLEEKVFTEAELLGILADRLGVPPVDLHRVEIDADGHVVAARNLAPEDNVQMRFAPITLAPTFEAPFVD